MNTGVILQARMTSSRLPGKVLLNLNGKPMLERQINRILQVVDSGKLVVATSSEGSDDKIEEFCSSIGIKVVRGSLNNVYCRFSKVLLDCNWDSFVRLTGDCPFFMPRLLDRMFMESKKTEFDFFSNTLNRDFPRGLDIEIVKKKSFMQLRDLSLTIEELEHVTLGFHNHRDIFKLINYSEGRNLAKYRWTVDTQSDFEFAQKVFERFKGHEEKFDIEDILKLMEEDSKFAYFE